MSFFSNNQNSPKVTIFPLNWTTSQVIQNTTQFLNMYYIKAIINNRDNANSVTVRVNPSGDLLTIPPSSQGVIENEIHSYLEINPDAVTGIGDARLELTPLSELKRLGLI